MTKVLGHHQCASRNHCAIIVALQVANIFFADFEPRDGKQLQGRETRVTDAEPQQREPCARVRELRDVAGNGLSALTADRGHAEVNETWAHSGLAHCVQPTLGSASLVEGFQAHRYA